jgi:hypothetical protein
MTSARWQGPGADVCAWRGGDGEAGLSLVFAADLARHRLLVELVPPIVPFLRNPGVAGVAPLRAWDAATGTYSFGGGPWTPVAEWLRGSAPLGVRAALELFRAAAEIADRAASAARRFGLPCHGALTPWRVVVAPDGRVGLLGYGIPPADAMAWLDEERDAVDADALRFLAPEVLEDGEQDARADWYSLALMATELATGRPVFRGSADAVARSILEGGGPRGVEEAAEGLSDAAFEVLATAV